MAGSLLDLQTPALIVETAVMDANIGRLTSRLGGLGVSFRPHLKTAKSVEIARRMMVSPEGPATVSTLKEAEQFARAGVKDILYAVGIAPSKLDRVVALRRSGVELAIILDNLDQARAVGAKCTETGTSIPVMIEIDSDGHRAGLRPDDDLLVEIGRALANAADLRGVMTHGGGSYDVPGEAALRRAAAAERDGAVAAAERLRAAGLPCPVVSVGSTPTALYADHLRGVDEVRAGVFVFCDLVMAGLGVCRLEDIALSVLATVIGHQTDNGWIVVDAGWMAMSRDRGTAAQKVDQGFGLACSADGAPYPDLIMTRSYQEHGVLALRPGSKERLPDLPVGSVVRILPNHACATAAQHDRYHAVSGGPDIIAEWPRFGGWS